MVGSGERFNTAVTVTCTVGLVIVLQRMRALQRQVDTLAELVRGQETSLQWLTQRMETPVIRVSFSGSIRPHTAYPHSVPVLLLCPPLHQPWPPSPGVWGSSCKQGAVPAAAGEMRLEAAIAAP